LASPARFSSRCSAYSAFVVPSMPAAASPRSPAKHPRSSSVSIRWNRLVNRNSGSLRALHAMRCSFVATGSPRLGADGVSSHRPAMCRLLSSGGIARLLRYYETIRLPVRDGLLLSSCGCRSLLPSVEARTGPPGLPRCRNVVHAMVPDSGAQAGPGHCGPARVDFRQAESVVLSH
jgi:hypothetical protein